MRKLLKASAKTLPYIAAGTLAAVVPDIAWAAGGNPIVNFFNTAVTQVSLGGFGLACLGGAGALAGMGTGNHQVVAPAAKAGASGAGIAGIAQVVGLFIPNGGGATLDLVGSMSATDWMHLVLAIIK